MNSLTSLLIRFARCLPLLLIVSACGQAEPPANVKIGKPYSIAGKTYFPRYEPGYDKVGEASWYGPGFHGKMTASGETFDQNDLTAAHPTLPMPSLVRVTNLSNGKSAVVRINDRGPFKSNRIIDLSKRSAQTIGVQGVSKVRVQYLEDETQAYLAQLKNGDGKELNMAKIDAAVADMYEAETEDDDEQIVEATNANTSIGQSINHAAPVLSVNAGDIGSSELPDTPRPSDTRAKPVSLTLRNEDQPAPPNPTKTPEPVRLVRDEVGKPLPSNDHEEEAKPITLASAEENGRQSPAAGGHYHIQVGAFSLEENARKLQQSLSGVAAVTIGKIQAAGAELWRVKLGPFTDYPSAEAALQRVHALGAPDARITK